MADLTGQDIGPYHVEEEIGRGGMATVYRARQHNLNRDVAIKVLPAEMSHNTTFLARFEREVKLIARLQHARILPVYDYGEFNGQPYIVMAYLTGGTLRDRLRAERLSLEHAVYYIHQIAEGLDYLHQKGVIHRDFKSSNVLLDKSQQNCFLADFGIARFQEATAVTLTGQGLVGTPAYMAPEMYEKGQLSTSVDVYALPIHR
jgi:serine/threonine protein kinase